MEKNEKLFIPPSVDLGQGDIDTGYFAKLSKLELQQRWREKGGAEILAAWKKSNYQRHILDSLVGRYYGHTDLRGVNLSNTDLSGLDMHSADLYGANLQNCILERANLSGTWLSESNIKGTNFNWANMDEVLLDKVTFDSKTTFYGVNLNKINFTLAALLRELVIGQQRIHHLEEQHPLLAWFFKVSCDYGRSFFRFSIWAVGIILCFAALFVLLPDATSASSFSGNLYFSIITFTTLGYGDIYPVSAIGKTLVCAEVIIGYIMLGLLVAIISKRVIGS